MRVRNQVERQFRFGADCVQARRIDDDQALLQQWMRKVDDGMAPAGNLDHAVFIDRQRNVGVVFMVQAEAFGFFHADALGQTDLLERFEHAVAG